MPISYFRTRGYLPHLEIVGSTYFITLRLVDTLPVTVLESIRLELIELKKQAATQKLREEMNKDSSIFERRKFRSISITVLAIVI